MVLEFTSRAKAQQIWQDSKQKTYQGKTVKAYSRDFRFKYYENLLNDWINDSPPIGKCWS